MPVDPIWQKGRSRRRRLEPQPGLGVDDDSARKVSCTAETAGSNEALVRSGGIARLIGRSSGDRSAGRCRLPAAATRTTRPSLEEQAQGLSVTLRHRPRKLAKLSSNGRC